jgi:hypothetical protein
MSPRAPAFAAAREPDAHFASAATSRDYRACIRSLGEKPDNLDNVVLAQSGQLRAALEARRTDDYHNGKLPQ